MNDIPPLRSFRRKKLPLFERFRPLSFNAAGKSTSGWVCKSRMDVGRWGNRTADLRASDRAALRNFMPRLHVSRSSRAGALKQILPADGGDELLEVEGLEIGHVLEVPGLEGGHCGLLHG